MLPNDIRKAVDRLNRGTAGEADRVLVRDYLLANYGTLSPEDADMIGSALGASGGTEDLPETLLPPMDTSLPLPNGTDVSAAMLPGHESGNMMSTDWTKSPELAGVRTTTPADFHANNVNPAAISPARGQGDPSDTRLQAMLARDRQRNAVRDLSGRGVGGTDWRGQADELAGLPVGTVPEGSAFSGVSSSYLPGMAASPDLAAQQMAMVRNEGRAAPNAARDLAPQLQAALGLEQAGVLGGSRGLGGYDDPTSALLASEQFVNETTGPGKFVQPRAVYKEAFRNIKQTPTAEMWTGEGDPGSLSNVIEVTNGTLMAQAPYMSEDAANTLKARIRQAQDEYLMGVANGQINPDVVSYPEFLRTEKKARTWVGSGLTMERADAAI